MFRPLALAIVAPQAGAVLMSPEHARKPTKCGIAMLDSAIVVVPSSLKYLSKSPESTNPKDLAQSRPHCVLSHRFRVPARSPLDPARPV